MLKKILIGLLIITATAAVLLSYALADNPARAVTGTRKVIELGKQSIEYFIDGPSQGQTVVLQASYARSGSDFNELAAALHQAGYRTLVMQARGIDGSSLPSLQASLFDYAADLKAVLDAEQLQQPLTLVGHAFGNRIARSFASRYPERVKSLVLLSAGDSAPPDATRNAIFTILLNTSGEQSRLDALRTAFFAPESAISPHWVNGWYPKAGLAQGNATATTPAADWAHGGNAPMLVVDAEFDAAAYQAGEKLKNRYPERVTYQLLKNAGHAMLPEQGEQIAELVLRHLAKY
jgi:pimeloyl-ACP methyl ester carboxylesterase